jgi:hypothetical protein
MTGTDSFHWVTTGNLGIMITSALITLPAAILAGCSAKTSEAPSLKVGLGETVITPGENL